MISSFPNEPTAFPPLCLNLFLSPCWNVLLHKATFQTGYHAFKVPREELLWEAFLAAWGLWALPPPNSHSVVGDHLFTLPTNVILL